jgi:hypothetical protein
MSLLRRAWLLMAVVAVGLALLGVFSVVAGAQGPCTDEFTGAVSDAWENASNWTAGVPTAATVACWSGLTVVVSTGSQTADTVEASNGGGLTVTGGSLDVPGGQSPVGALTLSGGSLSGPFLDTGAFSWSGGTLEAAVWQTGGGAASISGTARATLIGSLSTTSPTLTITNPNVVAALPGFGEPGLATSGTMTFGPGVTIASGNANPQYAAESIASNAGPTYGFAGPYQLTLTGGGTTTVAAGTTLNPGIGGSTSLEAGSLTSGETLDVDGTLDGDVSAPYPYEGQRIEGSGVINGQVSVTGEASVDPGDPFGTLTVNGNYTQSNGQIGFAIGGTTPGSGYSQLVATGPIAFIQAPASGEFYGSIADLGVEPENGFLPSVDDSFDVVHSPDGVTAVLGNAANPNYPDDTGSASAEYGILSGPDDVILKVVPTNITLPTITGASGGDGTPYTTGLAYVGDTLTCNAGTWSYDPTSFTYVWSNPQFGSAPTHVVQPGEVGYTEFCTVYANNASGTGGPQYSQEIHVEARPGPPTIAPPTTTPPVNTQRPAITGSPVEGDTLVEVPGSWQANGQTETGTSMQWLRCETSGCPPIPGATAHTYTLVAADVGATIKVEESTSDSAGAGTPALSDPTAIVTAAAVANTDPNQPNPPNTLIVSSKTHPASAGLTLRVEATGDATGFECALVRIPHDKHAKVPRPSYKPCGSTITFKHLKAGKYEVYVRADGPGGVDKTPAKYTFTVA